MQKLLIVSIFLIFLTGCVHMSVKQINEDIFSKAQKNGFIKKGINTELFTIRTFSKITDPTGSVFFYIEGDGRAWINKYTISKDPTPSNDTVLQLAFKDVSDNVIYIARPCQYTQQENNSGWDKMYWTDKRFSQEVIDSINNVIDSYVSENAFSDISVIGFSGGAAIAVLCASQRNDIDKIITIAGNLDHKQLNAYHKVSELKDSLNPIDVAEKIKDIEQIHYIGTKDKVVPTFIAYDFKKRSGDPKHIKVVEVNGASHHKGWIDILINKLSHLTVKEVL